MALPTVLLIICIISIADYFLSLSGLKDLTIVGKKSVGTHVETDKEHRKNERNKIMQDKRGIMLDDGDVVSRKSSKRLEMLLIWREERDKQKAKRALQKATEKPIFKTGKVKDAPNIDKVSDEIKRKPIIRSTQVKSFAQPNHQFKAPNNIERKELKLTQAYSAKNNKTKKETKSTKANFKPEVIKKSKAETIIPKTDLVIKRNVLNDKKTACPEKLVLNHERKKWNTGNEKFLKISNTTNIFNKEEISQIIVKPTYRAKDLVKTKNNDLPTKDFKTINIINVKTKSSIIKKSAKHDEEIPVNESPTLHAPLEPNDLSPNVSVQGLIEMHKNYIKSQTPTKSTLDLPRNTPNSRISRSSSSLSDVYPMENIIDTDSDSSPFRPFVTKLRGKTPDRDYARKEFSNAHSLYISGVWSLSPNCVTSDTEQYNNNENETENEKEAEAFTIAEMSPQRHQNPTTTPKSILKSKNLKSTGKKNKGVLFRDNNLVELFRISPLHGDNEFLDVVAIDENNSIAANIILTPKSPVNISNQRKSPRLQSKLF